MVQTVAEYLAFERASEERHEFVDGEVRSMSSSQNHSLILVGAMTSLYLQLRSTPSEVFAVAMRVGIPPGYYVYPDVVAVYDKPQLEDEHQDTLLNPNLIIEILSPVSEAYDRGRKFQLYQTLPSLQEYLLIAQDEPQFEHYLRQDNNQWLYTRITGLESQLEFPSIGCTLALADVYHKVVFKES